ncbi:hypothetical protein [Cryobacterium serini]|nr:hypothetical protein [Cryobacterium serini]
MRKITKTLLGGSAVLATLLAGVGMAQASGDTPTSIERNGSTFYAEDQIDSVWQQVVQDYPEKLPAGIDFPALAPAFFHPVEEGDHLFEEGLTELIAARYWRCAWLDDSIQSSDQRSIAGQANASAALEKYSTLPEVSAAVDVPTYLEQIGTHAAASGEDIAAAEFRLDCGIYVETEATK